MKIRRQDASLTPGGEVPVVPYPVSVLSTYGCNALVNCFPAYFSYVDILLRLSRAIWVIMFLLLRFCLWTSGV